MQALPVIIEILVVGDVPASIFDAFGVNWDLLVYGLAAGGFAVAVAEICGAVPCYGCVWALVQTVCCVCGSCHAATSEGVPVVLGSRLGAPTPRTCV